ncbi:unnamed protein product [Auanema sp. JU1783]|nr:unnamed protein product [Auanema sp. JU1783]
MFFNIGLFLSISYSLCYAQIVERERLQHDLAKFLSTPRYNETEKSLARAAIRNALDGIGLYTFTHSFLSNESNEMGVNVISIQRGPYFATDNDTVVVVCANYDTKEDVAGVDDNGSGVAATLEIARAMATFDRLYARQSTIMYVFVDRKHESFSGSHEFVEDVLLPFVKRTNATITSVIVLDGIMHFDPFPSTQGTPRGFEETFPGPAQQLHEHMHMGDFIQTVGRDSIDDELVQSFTSAFSKTAARLKNDWTFHPWVLSITLNLDEITTMNSLLQPYLFSDHSSFYFHSRNETIPTLYVTDTLNYRGVKQYCNYCDTLYMITEPNMRFLTLITDTLIRTVAHLSQSDALAVLDEIQTPHYT